MIIIFFTCISELKKSLKKGGGVWWLNAYLEKGRGMFSEGVLFEHNVGKLYQQSVHPALVKWEEALHEPDVAASLGDGQNKIGVSFCLCHREGWGREGCG